MPVESGLAPYFFQPIPDGYWQNRQESRKESKSPWTPDPSQIPPMPEENPQSQPANERVLTNFSKRFVQFRLNQDRAKWPPVLLAKLCHLVDNLTHKFSIGAKKLTECICETCPVYKSQCTTYNSSRRWAVQSKVSIWLTFLTQTRFGWGYGGRGRLHSQPVGRNHSHPAR